MKFNEANIFVFIAAIIIGILISLNIHFGATNTRVVLNSKQYQDAYNTKNKLAIELSNLKEMYYQNTSKLNDYKYTNDETSTIVKNISKELEMNNALLGYSKVSGEGIKLTIMDSSNQFSQIDENAGVSKILHNTDMIQVVNELKIAGAEAISINGQRILTNSAVYCFWAFLDINNEKTPAPFYVRAIGNKDLLNKYVTNSNSYIKALINRGISVQIEESTDIKIPNYAGEMRMKKIRPYNQ